jgi:DNA end-binding protein Ku
MWAGTLAFGLVEIPVRLGPATRPRELAFRQVHAEDGGRITFRRSCTACGADVSYAQVAKAYQQPGGALVPLTDEDLASLPLEARHRIEVQCFVAPGTIDPLLVSRSYFLAPGGPVPDGAPLADAGQAYTLFQTALARSGRVAVAKITLRQREARAALWARGPALVLQTLLTPGELTDPTDYASPAQASSPGQASGHPDPGLSLAADLIAAMTGEFDPGAHHDRYRDQLDDLIQRKNAGDPTGPHQIPDSGSPADESPRAHISHTSHLNHGDHRDPTDLTDLLRASLAAIPTAR